MDMNITHSNMPGSSCLVREHDDYVSLSQVSDKRLDALAGNRNPQTIPVRSTTFAVMSVAHDVLLKVGYEIFPDGPGNQQEAILMSQGLSFKRSMLRQKDGDNYVESHVSHRYIREIKKYGGGNCYEYASAAMGELYDKKLPLPVFSVKECQVDNRNHHYVIVGDWRDRTTGDEAVVVDPWQGLKKIHTYGERLNQQESPIPLGVMACGNRLSIFESREMQRARAQKPMSAEAIQLAMRRAYKDLSELSPGQIIQELSNNNQSWSSVSGAKNLFTRYQSPDGRSAEFDLAPRSYIATYLQTRAAQHQTE